MKTPYALATVAALVLPLLASGPAAAHHGWSGQDNAHVTTLEGKIEAVRYRNPHGEIDLASGGQTWTVTLAPIGRMQARGLTEAQLKVGETVKINGHRNLDMAKHEVKANDITVAGHTTSMR